MTDYELVRSARKTLAISVDRAGHVTVRAPLRMSLAVIEAFVTEKQAWIAQTQAKLRSLPQTARLAAEDGATLPFQGEMLTLRHADVRRVTREGSELLLPRHVVTVAPIARWLDAQAQRELPLRVEPFAQRMGCRPQELHVTHAKGRWGSMSSRGSLRLNRALMLCPPEMLDYVIVHELSHMPHPNHSPAFWAHVERYMPDYRARRDWLKQHASLIDLL